jgi:hypothetical protein
MCQIWHNSFERVKTAEILSIQISTNDRKATPATPTTPRDRRKIVFRSKLILLAIYGYEGSFGLVSRKMKKNYC